MMADMGTAVLRTLVRYQGVSHFKAAVEHGQQQK
jgi:hypothetical protein